jgi:hypothetical protein
MKHCSSWVDSILAHVVQLLLLDQWADVVVNQISGYRGRALLSGCTYNPTGRKWVSINEMRLMLNYFFGALHLDF